MTATEDIPLEVWTLREAIRIKCRAVQTHHRAAKIVRWWDDSYRVNISGPDPLDVWLECWRATHAGECPEPANALDERGDEG